MRLSSDRPGTKSKHSSAGAQSSVADPDRKKKKRPPAGKKQKNVYNEICMKFQRGGCSEPCPHGRRHIHGDQDKTGGGGGQDKGKGSGKGTKGR